ncbi:hypothetical protein P4159_25540, partial [Bacillus thuringiensis]|nr:hypothetical protein [Bacillus thuringiensis]
AINFTINSVENYNLDFMKKYINFKKKGELNHHNSKEIISNSVIYFRCSLFSVGKLGLVIVKHNIL